MNSTKHEDHRANLYREAALHFAAKLAHTQLCAYLDMVHLANKLDTENPTRHMSSEGHVLLARADVQELRRVLTGGETPLMFCQSTLADTLSRASRGLVTVRLRESSEGITAVYQPRSRN